MKGVVDAHPMDGEIVVSAQLAVSEHLLAEMAQLDVEYAAMKLPCKCPDGFGEKKSGVMSVSDIFTFAHDAAVSIYIRWKNRSPLSDNGQQMAHNTTVRRPDYGHVRFLARRLFV